jgi:hypothetical protein
MAKKTVQLRTRLLLIERLEARCVLSAAGVDDAVSLAAPAAVASQEIAAEADLMTPTLAVFPSAAVGLADPFAGTATALAAPYTPANIAQAYGFNNVSFPNGQGGFITGTGAGQTIAVVVAYNQPNLAADLHAFDQQFGLADPQLTICNQTGSTNTSSLPSNATGTWGVEASLDVEWAHALAPAAKILVVEAVSANSGNLFQAVDTARSAGTGTLAALPYVTVVTMSWGSADYQGDSLGTPFSTPAGKSGVTFVASTGDSGTAGQYPATDPRVLAVGGTSLTINSPGSYGGEVAWSGSAGGFSADLTRGTVYNAVPSYQQGIVPFGAQNTLGARMTPDVSFDADLNKGLYIYDSYDFPTAPWRAAGGTSAAAPCWAALIALADQGASSALTGNQVLTSLYSVYSAGNSSYAFHDVTSGANHTYSAGTGFDLVTGLGSPRANVVAATLAGISETPVPVAPSGNITTATPTFRWNPVGGASGYYLTVVDTTTQSTVVNGLPVMGTSYTPTSALSNGHTYQWSVQAYDGYGALGPGSAPQAFTVALVINHAPVGTDATVSTPEGVAYRFTASDFGFSDPNDNPPNGFLAVKVTTLPEIGTLVDNGNVVAAGQLIPVSDIDSGLLQFVSVVGSAGDPYTSFTFQVEDDGGTANGGVNIDPVPKTMTIDVIAPPEVVEVVVSGSSWSPAFLEELQAAGWGAAGYAIPVGTTAQMQPLPWGNLNQIRITFNQPVNVQQQSLQIAGLVGTYSVVGFQYDPASDSAIWTLQVPLGADSVTIDLQSTGPAAVTDVSGHALDGEWTNQASNYPSGNGIPGGDFQFQFNVLPGDVNQDGIVDSQDLALMSSNWLVANAMADTNGDDIVNSQDIALIASNWLSTLPAAGSSLSAAGSSVPALQPDTVDRLIPAPAVSTTGASVQPAGSMESAPSDPERVAGSATVEMLGGLRLAPVVLRGLLTTPNMTVVPTRTGADDAAQLNDHVEVIARRSTLSASVERPSSLTPTAQGTGLAATVSRASDRAGLAPVSRSTLLRADTVSSSEIDIERARLDLLSSGSLANAVLSPDAAPKPVAIDYLMAQSSLRLDRDWFDGLP